MIIGELYVIDIDSVRYKNKYTIRIYGKTPDGKKLILLDRFDDYFFIITSNPEEMVEFLKIKGVKDVSIEKMKLRGEPKEVVKVVLEDTRYAQEVKEHAKKNPYYIDHIEMDIPTFRRYMIDKDIFPLKKVRFKGEEIKSEYGIKTILLKSIEPTDDFIGDLKYLAFDIETYNPVGVGLKNVDRPIVIISIFGKNLKKIITTKRFETNDKDVVFVESEEDILKRFVEIIREYDPEIIFGYGSDWFDLPYILERCNKLGIHLRIGVDRSSIKLSRGRLPHAKIFGRNHIDLYEFVRGIIGPTLNTETYDLSSVAYEVIGDKKLEVKGVDIFKLWEQNMVELLARYCLKDSELTYKIGERFLPIIVEISKIVGQPIFDVSRMTYGLCDEWFLIKHAHEFNELIPEKPIGSEITQRLETTYMGAYVHQPKPGLYEKVVVFDFRSLYPSIIISHNICPTTIDKECKKKIYNPNKTHWFCKDLRGMIPTLLKELVIRRAEIKKILKEMERGEKRRILEARSYALKTIANAMYGYLGFPRSRWYSIPCAESVTAFGRYYIKHVISLFEENGFNVIYGDTDSIMISLNGRTIDDTLKIQKEINDNLPPYMDLEFQGFYPRGIFVSVKEGKRGAKKRYALIDGKGNITIKGFEYVRRDWAEIAKKVQIEVLKRILKDRDVKGAIRVVKDTINKIKSGKADLNDIAILTQITRPIKMYESKGPHVMAVVRAGKEDEYTPGSIVKYVVCKGHGKISDRSYLVEEYEEKNLSYDPDYYINNQVIPAVGRIFKVLGYDVKNLTQEKLSKFFK